MVPTVSSQSSQPDRLFRGLVGLTFLLAVTVIALGAYTRLTEAGLGCPDWPGCYGFLSVPQTDAQHAIAQQVFPDHPVEVHKAWNEMLHRYVAGSLGLLILTINLMAWRRRDRPRRLPLVLLGMVIGQAMLGMWTVTMALKPVVVMGHLLGGFTTASLLLLLWLRLANHNRETGQRQAYPAPPAAGVRRLAVAALVVVALQIALGGWTAANYAAVVCTQLPVCEVDWVSKFDITAFEPWQPGFQTYQYGVLNFDQRVSIHAAHRIGAMITTFVVLLLVWRLWRIGWRRHAWAVMALLAVQIGLGVTNVLASLPLPVAVGHNLGGLCLLLGTLVTCRALYRARSAAGAVEDHIAALPQTGFSQTCMKHDRSTASRPGQETLGGMTPKSG
ncbi:COX15/CtaA family protein [Photobacterium galatheae]|uniref:Cytochrome B561 n=1 Tax=Photobacterium galatheae TaxID=1654360 RepID=A0A066RPQ5_9GAMM|nr:COX15/CtaA family protein [Photobacterium galatheae]KDM92334.1 cytochrome B561 [Photobacterium galatheae]MCM0150845.1 COX15/CtaA family protein [Photobacterium galatheae]